MDGNQYCILWNNYQASLVETIGGLRQRGDLVDVTIVCPDGSKMQAHQLILASCSLFFKSFIKDNPSKHPVVLMPTEISYSELKAMIEFMYTGQVCVEQDKLQAFIRGARYLRIKGLEEAGQDYDNIGDDPSSMADENNKKGSQNHSSSSNRKSNVEKVQNKEKLIFPKRLSQYEDNDDDCIDPDQLSDVDNFAPRDKSDDEVVHRTPIVFPTDRTTRKSLGKRKRRRGSFSVRKHPVKLSNNVVFYEKDKLAKNGKPHLKDEPINKVRKMAFGDSDYEANEVDLCTCTSRKIWSLNDLDQLLQAWKETLTQVPPSYFIRSVSLCKSVARALQAKGVKKNWRQCQVKMKNLRREVRLFKEGEGIPKNPNPRKPSEVANACEQLLPFIDDIFEKEEEIRKKWYQIKVDRDRRLSKYPVEEEEEDEIMAEVAGLEDSDLGDDDDHELHHHIDEAVVTDQHLESTQDTDVKPPQFTIQTVFHKREPQSLSQSVPHSLAMTQTVPHSSTQTAPQSLTLSQTVPRPLTLSSQSVPQSLSLSQTIPRSQTLCQTIPGSLTLSQTVPLSLALTQTVPRSLGKTIPQSLVLSKTVPYTLSLSQPSAQPLSLSKSVTQSLTYPQTVPQSVSLSQTVPQSVSHSVPVSNTITTRSIRLRIDPTKPITHRTIRVETKESMGSKKPISLLPKRTGNVSGEPPTHKIHIASRPSTRYSTKIISSALNTHRESLDIPVGSPASIKTDDSTAHRLQKSSNHNDIKHEIHMDTEAGDITPHDDIQDIQVHTVEGDLSNSYTSSMSGSPRHRSHSEEGGTVQSVHHIVEPPPDNGSKPSATSVLNDSKECKMEESEEEI